jgi:hypothetical protein
MTASSPKTNGSAPKKSFTVKKGRSVAAQKVVIYGPGGVGKTELCSLSSLEGLRPLFLDVGNGTNFLDVERIEGIETWEELRDILHDESLLSGFNAIVIDDLTKAEELCSSYVIRTIPHEKGDKAIKSIEDYGWGKGLTHIYETFLNLLADLDSQVRRDRWVICVAHDCTANVPNPAGEDWIRYEPRLQSPASGKSSIRHRVKEWCDHLLFVGFDTAVNRDGKGMGGGTRQIYPSELPTHWAKSRSLADPIYYEKGSSELWKLLKGEH